ncbi:PilW family protein [Chitinilyticum litopenaei]|uniref:PilW family protein n=1 Tax=Chitinilyticum litopenaei TaxID=1121276 RepID=UPI00041F7156|nr:prepilin-type N-terminal cleavage/methylation domain-containing protein [Chitinilyticum litopenaei]
MRANYRKGHKHIPIINHGFTLIEILVALAIGMLVIGAAYSYFLSTLRTSSALVAQSRLQQEVRLAAELMQRDIRRAAYRPANAAGVNATPLYIGKTSSTLPSANCLIYAYYDPDSTTTVRHGGFVWHGNRLYMKKPDSTSAACPNDASADSNNWLPISSESTAQITGLSLIAISSTPPQLRMAMSARSPRDSAVNFSLSQNITLPNLPAITPLP